TFNIHVWTGYFFVSMPVRIDWQDGKLAPRWQCFTQTGHGFEEDGCETPVEEANLSARDTQTFVRMFGEASENGAPPEHVVVNLDSKVEIVAAKVRMHWNDEPEVIDVAVDDDVWVKVKIDGREGWIHTYED